VIEKADVAEIVRTHQQWVQTMTPMWERIGGAYADRFWSSLQRLPLDPIFSAAAIDKGKTKVEINLLRPWALSFLASLYYKGVQFANRADPLEEKIAQPKVEAVAEAINAYFRLSDIETTTSQGLQVALLYEGTGAFKIGVDDHVKVAHRSVWIEATMPWEVVFDRRVRTKRSMRYKGYLRHITREEFEGQFGRKPEVCELVMLPSVVKVVLNDEHGVRSILDHVRLLELYDMSEDEPLLRFFTVGNAETGGADIQEVFAEGENKALKLPLTADQEPMNMLIPLVVDNPVEHVLYNLAPALSLYRLNTEMNFLISDMATGYRRTMGRVLAYLKNKGVDATVLEAIERGDDMVMAGLEGETLEGVFKFVEQQPIHSGVLEYRAMLEKAIPQVQLTAGMSRGTPGQYLSATEVQFLSSYTETMIGRMRRSADAVLTELGRNYLKLLSDRVGSEGLKVVLPDGRMVKLTKADLARRWVLSMADGAITPMASQQRKMEFAQIEPLLKGLIEGATMPEASPKLRGAAAALYNHVLTLFGLPESLRFENLPLAKAEPPPEPPPPPAPASSPPPPAGGGEAPITDDPSLLNNPVGRAAAARAAGVG
jgi:hypothetical protein